MRRAARVAVLAVLLAGSGLTIGFLSALVRPRPKSRYAALGRQPVASEDSTIASA
jgi:hypothetical protein